MNITRYMKAHEAEVRERLGQEPAKADWPALRTRHAQMMGRMQHERLIHLLVTLAFAVFLLVVIAMVLASPSWALYALLLLILALLVPYVSHYFFLENTVQRWYELADEIEGKINLL